MPIIDFKVTPDAGINGYWIAVDNDDIDLTNGQGSKNLNEGEHVLVWWMYGDPGKGIAIVGTRANGEEVVKVKKSKIPANKTQAAGVRGFIV